ncbi:MAG TPA: haloacid dehalogenase [Parvularcula sp.]|nr:haloacid dehalogenase [Parvularcula sp.]HBS31291.1 haloacid dehalogenase [Parvularcula sp.]HBS35284.1 haloacid dehalogenase [Parvularcula sp.]
MDLDAIIFDCDGVLVDSEVLAMRGERAALEALGLSYTAEEFVRRFMGLHDRAYFDLLKADFRAAFGAAAPDDFETRVMAGRRREMAALTIIDGADRALVAARESVGRIAVASSSRAEFLEAKLKRMGLHELAAPHVYSADLVAAGKPAPDIFLYAAEKIGADPARCLVLEDSVNGVRAGRAAGMTVWGFTGGGHCFDGHGARLAAAGAGRIIPDFTAFLDAVA